MRGIQTVISRELYNIIATSKQRSKEFPTNMMYYFISTKDMLVVVYMEVVH